MGCVGGVGCGCKISRCARNYGEAGQTGMSAPRFFVERGLLDGGDLFPDSGPGCSIGGGSDFLHDFSAKDGCDFSTFVEGPSVEMAVEESGGPAIARTGCVDYLGDGNGAAVQGFFATFKPGPFCTKFDGGDIAEGAEFLQGGFRILVAAVGGGFVFVGEDGVDVFFEKAGKDALGGTHDFEGTQIETYGATGIFRAVQGALSQFGVEEEVSLDVGVVEFGKVGGFDFAGGHVDGGTEVGAHGALGIGRDEAEAAGGGDFGGVAESLDIAADDAEHFLIVATVVVHTEFAYEGSGHAHVREGKDGVCRRAAGGFVGCEAGLGHEAINGVGVNQFHSAFGTTDDVEE